MSQPNIPSTPILLETNTRKPKLLQAAYWSEVGLYHNKNEDSCCIHYQNNQPYFCAVADGVGGGSSGDVASQTLVQYAQNLPVEILNDDEQLSTWFKQADKVVAQRLAQISNRPGASTFVGIWFLNIKQIKSIHVGDCRLYRLRNQQLEQLSTDQTYQNLNLTPPTNGQADDPARMVGVSAIGSPDIGHYRLKSGDKLLLCSDGLHKFINENQLIETLSQKQIPLQDICQQLVSIAKKNGSHDDVSAVIVQYEQRSFLMVLIIILLIELVIIASLYMQNIIQF